jgi:hypothetical protein
MDFMVVSFNWAAQASADERTGDETGELSLGCRITLSYGDLAPLQALRRLVNIPFIMDDFGIYVIL